MGSIHWALFTELGQQPWNQFELHYQHCIIFYSDQRLVIFPANRNRNRFAEPTSVRIGIGIVCEFQNLGIGIGIIFVRWEVFATYSQIPEIYFISIFFFKTFFFLLTCNYFVLTNLPCKQSHREIYAYSLYIFNIGIRYSLILWKYLWIEIIFVNLHYLRIGIIFMKWNCGE